jgi:hypothetical protein
MQAKSPSELLSNIINFFWHRIQNYHLELFLSPAESSGNSPSWSVALRFCVLRSTLAQLSATLPGLPIAMVTGRCPWITGSILHTLARHGERTCCRDELEGVVGSNFSKLTAILKWPANLHEVYHNQAEKKDLSSLPISNVEVFLMFKCLKTSI